MNELELLYQAIDKRAAELMHLHGNRLRCFAGCCTCCVDDITVYEVEADYIRAHYADLLEHSLSHAREACAFLDDKGLCRIYAHRPYVCRTQGLPLHWLDENEDGTTTAFRDICPVNNDGTPVETLPEEQCWIVGPSEEQLAIMQYRNTGKSMTRIRLRDMFKQQPD